ncbi:MAG TPA: acyl-CoA dehydrogenase family protein, partial [Acidimicrobiales bacterium]|nr:acyl-CoA dehydrogenase family protein [Acidimicrobiales bacterium]
MAPDLDDIRLEVSGWIRENWDPELSLVEWRSRLADSGWACPSWPPEWCGRGFPAASVDVVTREIAAAGAVGVPEGVGMHLAAPTILEHGSQSVKEWFIRKTVTGEFTWCQLFSEPGAGSDLAGLTTRADRDGEQWIVTGQKVWNTSAGHADFGLLLARTNWDVPKHAGITSFAIPMHQAGVEVRPLRQMNGHASFNEVFLDEARVPADHVIGAVDGGWRAALTTLAHERRLAPVGRGGAAVPARPGRAWREAAEELARVAAPYTWYPQRAGRVDLVVPRAVATGRVSDPLVRQEIARLVSLSWASRWTAQRVAAARALGRPPGPEGSIAKLASSRIARAASGAHGMI